MSFNINTILFAVMGVLLIVVAYKWAKETLLISFCKEESSLDNLVYNVQCDYKDRKEAANLLSQLDKTGLALTDYVFKKYGSDKTDAGMLARNLKARYRGRERLVETDPDNRDGDTSYTVDKGWLLAMCVRTSKSKDSDSFHNLNVLKFVLIHEMAHIAANVQDHPVRFWEVFKWLLGNARDAGLYDYHNFHKDPIRYCDRLLITYTPLDDGELKSIN